VRNIYLDEKTRLDIDQRIDRIHKDLGRNADRPIELAEVRALLRLDLDYYTADDPHLASQVVHSLKIGAKRIADAPRILLDTVRKFDLRALFLWKPKRILIDAQLPDLKKRWSEAHEISHSVIPWHEDYTLGDDTSTLSPGCHERIEAEANYGAGRLLFPPRAFVDAAASSPPSMEHVRSLSRHFGNSITTTLWRFVESFPGLSFGMISQHPHHISGSPDVEHLILSRRMIVECPAVTEDDLFAGLRAYCSRRRGGPLGAGTVSIANARGTGQTFTMDSFGNTHQVLTLGWSKD
jgi:Zn-dependent peptidase ImmA (M78 family)